MLGSPFVRRRLDVLLVAIFMSLSFLALYIWQANDMHEITGDEPHYLVIADGLLPTFEIEQTGPYTREFQNRTIMENGLASSGEAPTPANTHAELGPRGLFNVHNIGLPVLLAVPYLLLGEVGARLAMIAIGGLIVFLLTQVVSLSALSPRARFVLLLPLVVGMPLLPAATQIYPDLPGGALCLLGMYMLWRGPKDLSKRTLTLSAIALAFLPWLHIRYSLPMGIILLALAYQNRLILRLPQIIIRLWLPAALSLMLLASYNVYAFGNASGPYSSGDIMLNRVAIMQFMGLLFDQNQGLLIQQPLHLVGLLFLIPLFRQNTIATSTTLLVMLTTLGPNATHWNLYGGWSFSGRFGWTATVVLLALTALALSQLWEQQKKLAITVLAIGGAIQIRYLWGIFIQKIDLFPRIFDGWIGTYATFWGPVESWLPQWRDYRWAYSYLPNFMVLLIAFVVVAVGAMTSVSVKLRRNALLAFSCVALISLGTYARWGDLPFPQQRWAASALPSQIGTVTNLSRVATSSDGKGFLSYGPFFKVPEGDYEVGIQFSASSDTSSDVGQIDVYIADKMVSIESQPLPSTNGINREMFFPIRIDKNAAGKIEIRTTYLGEGSMTVHWIQLRNLRNNTPE